MKSTIKISGDSGTQITLTGVRLSFVTLDEPKGFNGSDQNKKYSVTMLLEKNDHNRAVAAQLATTIKEVVEAKWPEKETRPPQLLLALRDGDKTDREEQQGHWFIPAKSKDMPALYQGRPLEECGPDVFYSGCYATVQFNVYAYAYSGTSNGVAAGLNAVAFQAKGERFGVDARAGLSEAMADLYDGDDPATSDAGAGDELDSMLS